MPRVLFVYTSVSQNLKGGPSGWFLPEGAHPYYVLAPHVEIDFAAPAGPNPPVDPGSVEMFKDEESANFLVDPAVKAKLGSAKKLSDVNVADYDAIFYPGGHGPVIDLAADPVNARLASSFWASNKIVSAVCHGTAALVGATDPSDASIFIGRNFTGYSNAEEELLNAVDAVPFLLEDKIQGLGGKYEKATEPWGPKVVIDGKLITGQNPASAKGVGKAILQALK